MLIETEFLNIFVNVVLWGKVGYFPRQPKLQIPWTLTWTRLGRDTTGSKQTEKHVYRLQEGKETLIRATLLFLLLSLLLLLEMAVIPAAARRQSGFAPAELLPPVFICWRRSIRKVIYGRWWMAIGGAQTGSRCRPPLFQEALRATKFPANNHVWPPQSHNEGANKRWVVAPINHANPNRKCVVVILLYTVWRGAGLRCDTWLCSLSDLTQDAGGGTAEQWALISAFMLFF